MWEASPWFSPGPRDRKRRVVEARGVTGPALFDHHERYVLWRGCEAVNVSYEVVVWADLYHLRSNDLIPQFAICPDSEDVRNVSMWDGMIVELVGYVVTMPRAQGHAREALLDLGDLVQLEHLVSRYE